MLAIGNGIAALPDQNRDVREAANGGGVWVDWGDITHGQILRFNVTRLATVAPGPPGIELTVFDSQGNVVATHVFPNQNQNGGGVWISFFDLSADQLPASAFDNTGRAQVTGILRIPGPHVAPGPDNCGFVTSGEIFDTGDVNRRTLVHIAGAPLSECRNH
jgi:hypothetical protein